MIAVKNNNGEVFKVSGIFKRIKSKFTKFLKNLGEENDNSFGGQKLDCCDLNKKNEANTSNSAHSKHMGKGSH